MACPEQGISVAAAMTSKVICEFQPRFASMNGIAAGLESEFGYGDVIVAPQTWDCYRNDPAKVSCPP